MENYLNQKENAELVQILIQKSWASKDFKNRLIESPISVIGEIAGKTPKTSTNIKVVVEDQTDESILYLNIPSMPNLEELQLTDEQLELVAGGATPLVTLVIIGFGGTWALDKVF